MLNQNIIIENFFNAGVHLGHQTRFWNPKMKPYIYSKHNGIHIINLDTTINQFYLAIEQLKQILINKGKILFVGTKKIFNELIPETALNCKQFYINKRWLGGTLTNWNYIKNLICELKNLENDWAEGKFEKLNNKECIRKIKKMKKLQYELNGIKNMQNLPDALFIIDAKKESLAIKEAFKLNIQIFGIVDTDSNPENINFVIPGNDDSIKSIKLYLSILEEELK